MSTSAEQLNDAIAALNAAADAYNRKIEDIDDRVNGIVDSLSGAMDVFVHIDAINGNDENDGSPASPIRTVQEAANRSFPSCQLRVDLITDVVVTDRIAFSGRQLIFSSDVFGTQRRIDFANEIDGVNTNSPCIRVLENQAVVDFNHVTLGNNVASPHVLGPRMVDLSNGGVLQGFGLEIDTQAGQNFALAQATMPIDIYTHSSTFSAEQAGLWLNGVAAGTDPAAVARLRYTNLTSL